MTACSSHPGTLNGAALKELLESAESCGALLRTRIGSAAQKHQLSYAGFALLSRIASGTPGPEQECLAELRQLGLVSDDARAPDLLPAGARLLAAVNAELAGWLDEQAAGLDSQHSRTIVKQLRTIASRIS